MRYRKSLIILLVAFGLVHLADIITTVLCNAKHNSFEFEIQPLYIMGVSIYILYAVKLFAVIIVILCMLRKYPGYHVYLRYFMVYVMTFSILLIGMFVVNNLVVFSYPTEQIQPLPKEERVSTYNEMTANMGIVEHSGALIGEKIADKTNIKVQIPTALWIFMFNFIVFIVWHDMEKGICDKRWMNLPKHCKPC